MQIAYQIGLSNNPHEIAGELLIPYINYYQLINQGIDHCSPMMVGWSMI